jgi:hypothetical protein
MGAAERLTRRSPGQEVELAGLELRRFQETPRRDCPKIAINDWPISVRSQRPSGIRIHLNGNPCLETGGLETQIKAAGTGEEAYDCFAGSSLQVDAFAFLVLFRTERTFSAARVGSLRMSVSQRRTTFQPARRSSRACCLSRAILASIFGIQ